MSAFIVSQFQYCQLIWMNHSRKLNNKINRIHERALRIVYNDYSSSFEELLKIDDSVTIHVQNIRALMIEMFKVKLGEAPELLNDIFEFTKESNYSFRTKREFQSRTIRSENFGSKSLMFLGPKLWNDLPEFIKDSKNILDFKGKIKKWSPEKCPCSLCKIYVHQVGFVEIS